MVEKLYLLVDGFHHPRYEARKRAYISLRKFRCTVYYINAAGKI